MISGALRISLMLASLLLLMPPVLAKDKLPETTKDGLTLKTHSHHGAVYVKDGASLAFKFSDEANNKEIIEQAEIKFKVRENIKKAIAEAFPKAFSKELEKGGYQVVNDSGKGILLLRPAIINLTVTAPETNSAGIKETFVRSNGSMTLYMELYDSATRTRIAEVIDAEAVGDTGFVHRGGRISNQMEFDETMRDWAHKLRKRLDEAHGK